MIVEGGETTLLISTDAFPAAMERHPTSEYEDDLVWVRFATAMGWEVVGFLSKVTGALAAASVPIGAVCSYSRDHLFINSKYWDTAREVLLELFPESS